MMRRSSSILALWASLFVVVLLSCYCCAANADANGNEVRRERLSLEQGQDRAGWFFRNYLDANRDGRLTLSDLLSAADDIEEASSTLKLDATEQSQVAIAKWDLNGDGEVDEKEFRLTHRSADSSSTSGKQVHIAFTEDVSSIIIIWITEQNTTTSTVQYGLQSGSYPYSTTGISYTYDVGLLDGWHKVIHRVQLQELTASTQYFYRVGDPDDGFTQEFSFTTAPDELRPFTFALVGDMGTYIPAGWDVTNRMINDRATLPVEFYVHAGDLAYAGVNSGGELEDIWDVYGDQWEPLAANWPYMTGVGNHEGYYNFTSFRARYHMPGDEVGGVQNFWFSLDYSYAHFTFMSTEHDYCPGSQQYDWLVQDLSQAAANREQQPWIFVIGHRPMYCSDQDEWSAHNGESSDVLKTCVEPLLHEYGVDMMFTGHMHVYERTYPVYNNTVVQDAIISTNVYKKGISTAFLVQGNSGAFTDFKFVTPTPPWSVVHHSDYGYGRFEINATVLHYQAFELFTDMPSDEFWIVS